MNKCFSGQSASSGDRRVEIGGAGTNTTDRRARQPCSVQECLRAQLTPMHTRKIGHECFAIKASA